MQVAEKRTGSKREKVSLARKQRGYGYLAERGKPASTHYLTDARGTYAATSNGEPVHVPVLSAEASQPTPFLSLTWEQWLEMREQITRSLEHFASAAEEPRADRVLSAALEMQAALSQMFLETYARSADLGLSELPG